MKLGHMRRVLIISVAAAFVFSVHAADSLVKYREGIKAYEARDFPSAQKILQEFIAENPYEAEVKKSWYYLAVASAAQGHCHEAITRANIALERYAAHPDRLELRVLSAECLYKIDAHTRAEKSLIEIIKQIKSDALKYRAERILGLIYHDSRRNQLAIGHLKSAVRLQEKLGNTDVAGLFELHKLLGKIYADDPTQVEAAVAHLQAAIALGEKNHSGEARSLTLLMRNISLKRINKLSGLPDDTIADIRVDGDDIYVATWGGGLVRYLRSRERLEKIRLPSAQLRGLYVDFDDIFVTSFDGVYRIVKKTGKVATLSDDSGELKLAQKTIKDDRYIYFSTLNKGLIQYDSIKKKVVTLGRDSWVGSNQVYALDADVDYIVVGTLDVGAVILHKKTGTVTHIKPVEGGGENALRSENVKAVQLDGRYVYIGAHNDGVYTYDLELKKLTRLNLEIPFPSVFARRDHEIFIGTSGQGVRILNRNTMHVERLSAAEGLSSNEVQILRVEGDFLWVGYLENGIDVIYKPQRE